MIQANELRLGLIVKDGHDNIVLDKDSLSCALSGRCEFDPIPLTEEWLVKFGFEKNGESYEVLKGLLYLRGSNLEIAGEDAQHQGHCFFAPCKHVHQLQNLYFALTGEELKIK